MAKHRLDEIDHSLSVCLWEVAGQIIITARSSEQASLAGTVAIKPTTRSQKKNHTVKISTRWMIYVILISPVVLSVAFEEEGGAWIDDRGGKKTRYKY